MSSGTVVLKSPSRGREGLETSTKPLEAEVLSLLNKGSYLGWTCLKCLDGHPWDPRPGYLAKLALALGIEETTWSRYHVELQHLAHEW